MINKYKCIRESRKTLAIHVLPSGDVLVKAPEAASDTDVENFIKRKSAWISKQLAYFKQLGGTKNDKQVVSGSEMFFLGKQYRIMIRPAITPKEYVEISKRDIIIYSICPTKQERNTIILQNWLDMQLKRTFSNCFKAVSKQFPNMPAQEMAVRKLSLRWGSFLKKGVVVLNPSLIIAPKKCIQYVITHELCHFYHKDHSSAFYSMLGAKIPDWDKSKALLETYSKHI